MKDEPECISIQKNQIKKTMSNVETAIEKACQLIESSETAIKLTELANAVGLSKYHFHRAFKKLTGVTPKAYSVNVRANRVREVMSCSGSVTNAIYEAGYNAPSRFYEEAKSQLGMSASSYMKGGIGENITFAIAETSLGPLLVAMTEKGICAIEFGDNAEQLIEQFQDRFPKAELSGANPDFDRMIATVCSFVEKPTRDLNLPLDIRGTLFQRRVWELLRKIPVGETKSYKEIAIELGAPDSFRAVANACGQNRIALGVPCHRVVRTDGGLSGYRWGVERKKTLLDREKNQEEQID